MVFKKNSTYLLIFISLILLSSCKTKSTVVNTSSKVLSTNKVIKNHYTNSFNKNSLSAKLKIKYEGKESLPSFNANLRIKKDEKIWISMSKLGFPIGKVLITKNKVSYYEKINRTYFEGNFDLLSKFLGTELDFNKIQSLLVGEAILNLKEQKHTSALENKNYKLTPVKENALFNILYLISAYNFKVNKQVISQPKENKQLSISYNKYKQTNGIFFPEELIIIANDGKYTSTVTADYKTVAFDEQLTFPFTIPSGYKEIKLK